MTKLQILTLALVLCLAVSFAQAPVSAIGASKTASARPAASFRNDAPHGVIVKLRAKLRVGAPGDQPDSLVRIARRFQGTDGGELEGGLQPLLRQTANKKTADLAEKWGLDRVFVLELGAGADLDAALADLRSDDTVEYAEPNYLVKPGSVIPNDPGFGDQWGLLNQGHDVEEFPSTLNADVKAVQAWELTTGSPDVLIAVTDTGIDIDHPDLAGNIYTNPGEIPGNLIDDDQNGFVDDVHGYNVAQDNGNISDAVGHGTQMAGIIAARLNNAIGVSGMSQSKILPVKFFTRRSAIPQDVEGTIANAARSLLYAVAAGATIINASWSSVLTNGSADIQILRDAVSATNDAGVLLVGIAGNEGFNNDFSKVYPGEYQMANQIVVAASDFNDEIWHPLGNPFVIRSGFGERTVHLAAPGVAILTTAARGDCLLCSSSQDPRDWYTVVDGTSAAAAYVSGAAALVKSKYPDANFMIIKRRLLEGVDVRDTLRTLVATSGRLNALRALTIELAVSNPVLTKVKYKADSEKLTLNGQGILSDAVAVIGGHRYSVKAKQPDYSTMTVKVPKTVFPKGVAVTVKVRNPDGGESPTINLMR